jgi:hypothetical protein
LLHRTFLYSCQKSLCISFFDFIFILYRFLLKLVKCSKKCASLTSTVVCLHRWSTLSRTVLCLHRWSTLSSAAVCLQRCSSLSSAAVCIHRWSTLYTQQYSCMSAPMVYTQKYSFMSTLMVYTQTQQYSRFTPHSQQNLRKWKHAFSIKINIVAFLKRISSSTSMPHPPPPQLSIKLPSTQKTILPPSPPS